jgi:LysM repeat protein
MKPIATPQQIADQNHREIPQNVRDIGVRHSGGKEMTFLRRAISTLLVSILFQSSLYANGISTSGGLTLSEPFSARAAAIGESLTAGADEISFFGYNPASLPTLEDAQASFMYQQGFDQDSFGNFLIGSPTAHGGAGLGIGFYNGGDILLNDGANTRTVTAQRDFTVSLGYARKFSRKFYLGATGKYLSSEIGETAKAAAYAADLGIHFPLGRRVDVGAAVQNLGTQLKFQNEGDNLPRIARLGATFLLTKKRYGTTLFTDLPYHLNEGEARPSIGLEGFMGPMALRAGLKLSGGKQEFTVGTGFALGRSNIDYSFGLADQLAVTHRISVAMKMRGGREKEEEAFVEAPKKVYETSHVSLNKDTVSFSAGNKIVSDAPFTYEKRKLYVIQEGDTLALIARKFYGDASDWKRIHTANQHLFKEEGDIRVGQKILLP